MTLKKVLGFPLVQALEMIQSLGLPAPAVVYTLPNSRKEAETREGLTPRVIGVKENTLIVSCFRDQNPREKED